MMLGLKEAVGVLWKVSVMVCELWVWFGKASVVCLKCDMWLE